MILPFVLALAISTQTVPTIRPTCTATLCARYQRAAYAWEHNAETCGNDLDAKNATLKAVNASKDKTIVALEAPAVVVHEAPDWFWPVVIVGAILEAAAVGIASFELGKHL